MSYVTELLICDADEKDIERLNAWIAENSQHEQGLQRIDMDGAGGTQYFTSSVWATAINYAPSGLLAKLQDPDTWRDSYAPKFTYDLNGEEHVVGVADDKEVRIVRFRW